MTGSQDGIDHKIRKEIDRIARQVIEWEDAPEQGHAPTVRWKPRFDTESFVRDADKRLVPTDLQTYYDLQLSRGASRPKDPSLAWEFDDPADDAAKFAARNNERFNHLNSYIHLTPQTRILELGTRSGHFLYYLQSRGFLYVSGMDCVKLNVLWCRKNNLDVQEVDAHEMSMHYAPGSYDVIVAYHVLEHCFDPLRVLGECHKVLGPEGVIHIEIPISGLNPQTAHCYSFRRGELRRMLRSRGYKVLNHAYQFWHKNERLVATKQGG